MHYNKFCPCLFKNLYICTFKMKDLECSWLNFYWPLWNIMFLSSWLFLCTALNKWILLTNKEFPYGCIHSKLISFCTMLYLLEGSTVAILIYMKPYLWYLETWSIEGVLYLCVCSLFQFFKTYTAHIQIQSGHHLQPNDRAVVSRVGLWPLWLHGRQVVL